MRQFSKHPFKIQARGMVAPISKCNRDLSNLVIPGLVIGWLFGEPGYPQAATFSHAPHFTHSYANYADGEPETPVGKPSVEELKRINFDDSIRIAAKEKDKIAAREASLGAFAIKAGAEECLASDKNSRSCLVTIGTINNRAASTTMAADISEGFRKNPDSIALLRKRFLNEELVDAFESHLFNGQITNPYIEAVELDWKKRLSQSEAEFGKRKLNAIYREYLSELNLARAQLVSVMGSSDSIVLDSLLDLSLDTGWEAARGNRAGQSQEETRPIWSTIEAGLLPAELARVLDSLPSDELSPITRTRIGWFCGFVRRPATSRPSYAEALPLLIEVASRGGSIKQILRNYGPPNQSAEAVPGRRDLDSIPIRIWLAPDEKTRTGRLATALKGIDTSRTKPIAARFADLPPKMREEIGRRAANRTSARLSNRFGRWLVQFAEPFPRTGWPDSGTPDAGGNHRLEAAIEAFKKEIDSKNHARKLELYREHAMRGDANFVSTMRDNWIRNDVEINWGLINQRP